jgi:hypothetical protein
MLAIQNTKREGQIMFYVIVRQTQYSEAVESEYATEAEAIAECIHCLKQGSIVELVEE